MVTRRRRKAKSLAAQTLALGFAVPHVMALRLARIMSAGQSPSARDRAEFQRMGAEKLAAANEAWMAMATQVFLEYQKFTLMFMQSLWFPWMYPSLTPRSVSRQLNRAVLSILSKGLAPVSRRAAANVTRLGRIHQR